MSEMYSLKKSINSITGLLQCVTYAQDRFASLLSSYLENGATSPEQYIRYLSFQYHLTKGVQRYFFEIAAHHEFSRHRRLRNFLLDFGNEEEMHFLVAAKDLENMGVQPLPAPLDVDLWHAYFRSIVRERPFVRMGAAVILENISDGAAKPWVSRALTGSFLNKDNTKFLILHRHESLPHGTQIINAISTSNLQTRQFDELILGAKQATVMYLRMAQWAIQVDNLASICDTEGVNLSESDISAISAFDINELISDTLKKAK